MATQHVNTTDMTVGSPTRLILMFTLPLIAGNVMQQLYAFVDTLIVGRVLGVNALAAVGCCGALMFCLFGFTMGTTTGMSIVAGQKFGAKDFDGVRRSAATCFLVAICIGLALAVIGSLAARPVLELMQTPPSIIEGATSFMRVFCVGIICAIGFNSHTNLLRALGDSKHATMFFALALTSNILFEPLFIMVFGWGIPGAALGIMASQTVGIVAVETYIRRHVPYLRVHRADFAAVTRKDVWAHLRVGLPMGFQSSVIALGSIVIQAALNGLGPLAVAAYAAAQKIETIAVMPMMSFGMAMAAYAAQNYGARKLERIKAGVRKAVLMSGAFSLLIGAFLIASGAWFIEIFVGPGETAVIEQGRIYLSVTGMCYLVLSLLFIFRFTLQGLGQTFAPTLGSVMELGARILAAIYLVGGFGYQGICWSMPLAWLSALVPMAIAYWLTRRKLVDKEARP